MTPPGYLVLGRVVKPHGLQGEVKVACFAESWAPFRGLATVWLGPPEGPFRSFGLEGAREQPGAVVLKVAGVDTPEAAACFVGYDVAVPRVEAPGLPEGVYYHSDILGLQVVKGDRSLGSVREILETPAHDVYVIHGPAGEWMLPATRAHIRRIDLVARRIDIVAGMDLVAATSGGEGSAEAV